jgi:hypothetical protein
MVMWTDKQQYGLLGAEFVPNPSGSLDCAISIIEERREFASPITPSRRYDRVSRFLPEYSAEACQKVVLAASGLPSGVLEFKCAAWDDVASSQVMFAHLTRVIVTSMRDHLDGDAIIEFAFKHQLGDAYSILKGEAGGHYF